MRILVVEDEHKIANAIKKGLEQEYFAVDVAYNGDNGLDCALADDYDLVILDRMIPGESDGIKILKEMRANNIHTPVIFVTAKDAINDRVNGLNSGADDYLIKPFAFEELLARVRALLRRPQDNLDPILKYKSLTLDPQNFIVKRKGKVIELTTKEFALLEYIMRNQGRILTKENIISHIWDFDADILPNTVEVYIGYLRNKIDIPKEHSLIKTKRGFGYVFGEEK
ncbi:DNA-binding response regulator [bacterium CG_4_10_14_0_2_um_filter_33_32]|nr:MAG: DNA-binding response regulator [bacterium CG2_30_33_46]PIR67910.1 MAG: DNA-binding response regulator [bacterium CG10_big_fil_rev_8_21_14_0_10_33_18]PIU76914.1 MAG: DNA-binding response regulator [bacterium CG06_land_8_20_14_3_00_33_50]PIW81490.1 MAG: DNA-binding response regulator [bacterium CG_4_8_14_3_um_filter_33_28]PIY85669.1 MAG: DNA-binding response regulator [bacterium CG_4_10_14_0_8_um_filter_33_57]PIZ85571.1 MAG: DNA-binding response regulator [bacterium CG_4_10_14_0_2_um_fil